MMFIFAFLFPAWNFFDRPGSKFRCLLHNHINGHSLNLYSKPKSRTVCARFFYSPEFLDYLLFHSSLSHLAEEISKIMTSDNAKQNHLNKKQMTAEVYSNIQKSTSYQAFRHRIISAIQRELKIEDPQNWSLTLDVQSLEVADSKFESFIELPLSQIINSSITTEFHKK